MGFFNEYIKANMSSKDLENELLRLINEYNKVKKTYLIVYASAIEKHIPDIPINMADFYAIFDMLKDINSKDLDFYVETPGGRGEAVEEIVRFLRSRFENVSFIVSGEAKSAGTILVLSGDEIHMTKSGSLGPIDAQIRIGRSIVSAYDYLEWLNNRKEEAEESGRLNPLDATIISQISPGELNLVHHALKFAEDLVIKWLPKYKFKNWNITETRNKPVDIKMKKKRAKEIAQELMNHAKWRTHMRSIKIDDLEKIGLKINKIDQYPLIAEIIYRIQSVIRLFFSSTTIYKIFATADNKLFRTAAVTRKPVKIPKILPNVVEMDIVCQNCGKNNKLYAKFTPDPKIDEDFKKKGVIRFPNDNKLICDCRFEIDLGGIRNEIERKINKKIID